MHELNSSLKRGIRKPATFRKYVGGLTFGEVPIKKVSYDIGAGNKLNEFYCKDCLHFFSIQRPRSERMAEIIEVLGLLSFI